MDAIDAHAVPWTSARDRQCTQGSAQGQRITHRFDVCPLLRFTARVALVPATWLNSAATSHWDVPPFCLQLDAGPLHQ